MRPEFAVRSPRLAELRIPSRPHDVGLHTYGMPETHDIGGYDSPRWRLSQQWSDDPWLFETLRGGRAFARRHSTPEDVEWSYLRWAEGSRAESGAGLVCSLPPGDYLLVRSSLEPRRTDRVLLGNGLEPSQPNMLELLGGRTFRATVVGTEPDAPPVLSAPLIGVVALEMTGSPVGPTGAFFFASSPGTSAREHPGDLVLVVPVSGELVIHGAQRYSAEHADQHRRRWRERDSHQLAEALIGPWGS